MRERSSLVAGLALLALMVGPGSTPAASEHGQRSEQAGKHAEAEQVHQRVTASRRGADNTLDAQEQLTLLDMVWSKEPEAQKALKDLIAAFSTHKDMASEIWRIARDFGTAGNSKKALDLHQYNVEHFPKDKHAMWSQVEIIYYHIDTGDFTAAEADVEKLLKVFSAQSTLSKEIYQVAQKYEKAGKIEKALQLYQHNVEHFPDNMYGLLSKVYYHLRKAEYEAAVQVVNRLLAEFSGQPALAKEMYRLTAPLVKAHRFETSVRLYKYFLEKEPKDNQAIFARKGLALCYIELGDEADAEKAVQRLFTAFAGHERIAEAVYQLGMACYRARKFDRALALHQYNVEHFPKHKYAMWSQVEIVKSDIRADHLQWAETAYEKLLNLFALQPTLGTEICRVADTYLAAGNLEKAQRLYTYVLDRTPDNNQILWAKAGLIKLDIARGNEPSAQEKVDSLMEAFKNHADLGLALWQTAEGYYNRALVDQREHSQAQAKEHFAKVIRLGETIRRQLPASSATAEAYFYCAECYYQMSENQQALSLFRKVADTWPDYEHAWLALARISKIYKRFAFNGVMSKDEAAAALNVVYKRLLDDYPNCPAGETARRWFEQNVSFSEGEPK